MDVVHKFLNIAVPPFTILSLFLCLPSLYCFKLVLFFLRALFIEDMNGKVVLITGTSSGIGEQLAYHYEKKGAFLALVARREKACKRLGRGLVSLACRTWLLFGPTLPKPTSARGSWSRQWNTLGNVKWLVQELYLKW